MMEISISTPMPDDGNCQVIEHLEARPLRARRGWSAEAKARLVEKTLVPGANVSAIARGVGMAPSQLFGWRRQARVARAAIRNEAVDVDRPMRFERFAKRILPFPVDLPIKPNDVAPSLRPGYRIFRKREVGTLASG